MHGQCENTPVANQGRGGGSAAVGGPVQVVWRPGVTQALSLSSPPRLRAHRRCHSLSARWVPRQPGGGLKGLAEAGPRHSQHGRPVYFGGTLSMGLTPRDSPAWGSPQQAEKPPLKKWDGTSSPGPPPESQGPGRTSDSSSVPQRTAERPTQPTDHPHENCLHTPALP